MDLEELLSGIWEKLNATELSPTMYQYYNQLFNHRTIILNDDISEHIVEYVYLPLKAFEEDDSTLIAAETSWRGMADELPELHYLKGARFINQLKLIIYYGEFHPVEGETNIYSAISENSDDFDNLINAARKAVEHGYRVYILPNPRSCRTADFIFEKKGILGLYDLKTVHGKGSVGTQLFDSIGQTNRVLLNMTTDYNARLLSSEIKAYFEANEHAIEVLIFKGKNPSPFQDGRSKPPDSTVFSEKNMKNKKPPVGDF